MISNSTITDTTFNYNITKLNVQDATIDRCLFKGIINEASISGNLTRCQFEGLSNKINIEGPLYDMTIQQDITPTSADHVQDKNIITKFVPIKSLIISNKVVPRLDTNLHKECFIDIRDNKNIFMVQLATDDNSPRGIIVMWSGDARNIPKGYAICDGRTVDNYITTPDLSGRFIKMVGPSESVGAVNNPDLESDGKSIKIKEENLPNHKHNIKVTVDETELSASYSQIYSISSNSVNSGEGNPTYSGDDVRTSTGTIDFSHSHTATAVNNDNYANKPINVQPNYYALIFLMKL